MVNVKAHTRKTEGGKTTKVRAHNRRTPRTDTREIKLARKLDHLQNWLMTEIDRRESEFEDFLEGIGDLYGTEFSYHIWTPSISEYYLIIEGSEMGELKLGFSYDTNLLETLSERFGLPEELLLDRIPTALLGDYDRFSTISFDDDYIWSEIDRKMEEVRGS